MDWLKVLMRWWRRMSRGMSKSIELSWGRRDTLYIFATCRLEIFQVPASRHEMTRPATLYTTTWRQPDLHLGNTSSFQFIIQLLYLLSFGHFKTEKPEKKMNQWQRSAMRASYSTPRSASRRHQRTLPGWKWERPMCIGSENRMTLLVCYFFFQACYHFFVSCGDRRA